MREASRAGYYISLYMADNNILSPVQSLSVSTYFVPSRVEHSHWSRSLDILCSDWWNFTLLGPRVNHSGPKQSTFCLKHSSMLIFLTIWRQVMLKHYKRGLQLCLCIKFFWWVFSSLTFSERGATQNLIVHLLSVGFFKGNV